MRPRQRRDVNAAVQQVRGQIAGCENLALELEQAADHAATEARSIDLLEQRDAVLELQAQYEELLRLAGQAPAPRR